MCFYFSRNSLPRNTRAVRNVWYVAVFRICRKRPFINCGLLFTVHHILMSYLSTRCWSAILRCQLKNNITFSLYWVVRMYFYFHGNNIYRWIVLSSFYGLHSNNGVVIISNDAMELNFVLLFYSTKSYLTWFGIQIRRL